MERISRRDFMSILAGAGLLSAVPIDSLLVNGASPPQPQSPPKVSRSSSRGPYYSFLGTDDPKFVERYAGETLKFYVEVLRLDVADIELICKRLEGEGRYQSRFSVNLRNVYSTLSRYGELFMDTQMIVGKQAGKYRLMPEKTLVQHSFKGDLYQRYYTFDYAGNSYSLRRLKNGQEVKNQTKELRPGVIYDDPSTAFWNLRTGIYGPLDPGRSFRVRCLRFAGMRRYEGHVLIEEERKRIMAPLLKRYPEVKTVLGAKLSKQLFLDKPGGMVYIGFDPKNKPVFGYIPDIPTIGDVYAQTR